MSIFRRLADSQLVRGGIFVFIANNTANFGNFLYSLFMGRFLGPEAYGNLGALMSLLVIFSVPLGILSLLVVKLISSYWGRKDYAKIISLSEFLTPRLFGTGIIVFLLFVLSTPLLARFLNIDTYLPSFIMASYFILSFPAAYNRSVLIGALQFPYSALNGFVEIGSKLLISVILVMLNFGLIGALLGPLIGSIAGYLLTIVELKIIFRNIKKDSNIPSIKSVLTPAIPVLFAYLSLMVFFTMDIILVRHFFSAADAGLYTALSNTGRIIYYAIGPIITVMFPVISSRASKGISYILPLFGTLVITLAFSSVGIFAYFLFPKFIISILFGNQYLDIVPFMGIFAFYITIYSINSILTNFLLSVSYYKPIYPLFLAALSQSIFIFFFHENLNTVIWVNIFTSVLYLMVISSFVVRREYATLARIIIKGLPGNFYGR